MKINNLLNSEAKLKLLAISNKLKEQKQYHSRKTVSGEYYANEIAKLRTFSKKQLFEYIQNAKKDKGVKFAQRIAHSNSKKMYRTLDPKVIRAIEILNYARNRLYAKNVYSS